MTKISKLGQVLPFFPQYIVTLTTAKLSMSEQCTTLEEARRIKVQMTSLCGFRERPVVYGVTMQNRRVQIDV